MSRAVDVEGRGVRLSGRSVGVGSAIPDSVVDRPLDTDSLSGSSENGLEITVNSDWPSIGAEISANTSGATRAYLRDNSQTLISDVDISGLTSGDAFTFDNVNLTSGKSYLITLDAEGSAYTVGYSKNDGQSYPYTSTDVDITACVNSGSVTTDVVRSINNIGNNGF